MVLIGMASLSGALVGAAAGRFAWSEFVRLLGLESPLVLSLADVVVPVLVSAVAVGIGGNLASNKLVAAGAFDEIAARARACMDAVHAKG